MDTHESLKTRIDIGFAACMTQLNRTLLITGINSHYSRAQKIASLLSMGALADTLYQQYAVVARPMRKAAP